MFVLVRGTRVKISYLVASLLTSRQQVVFALLVPSCQQVWNKLLTTCNNLVDIIRLVARLFQQVRHSHDITILLQPCVINLVTFLFIMTVSDLLSVFLPCKSAMIPNAAKISCTNLRMTSVLTKTSLAAHYCLPATARTVCLRIGPCRTGNRAGARVRSFDLAKEARQIGEMAKFARCPVCKNNCKLLLFFLSLSFDLILYYFRFFKLMQYSFISCIPQNSITDRFYLFFTIYFVSLP